MSEQSCGCDKQPCGCCEGVQQLTPANECNRPGQRAISYRVGTHGQFLASMKARLSTMEVEGVGSDGQTIEKFRPLQGLTTREASDPSIALLDSWATVGDVLSFYQERIANEGYLRTATERRSVLEMANLVGYTLRPGVASTAYLAYTIDDKQLEPATIPAGARSQSIPGPGDLPQSFETSDPLEACASWNTFKPRMSRSQTQDTILNGPDGKRVYLNGINTNLTQGDPLLIAFGGTKPEPYRVLTVIPAPAQNQTLVSFEKWSSPKAAISKRVNPPPPAGLIEQLAKRPSNPPRDTLAMTRDLKSTFISNSDIGGQMVTNFVPVLKDIFGVAQSSIVATSKNDIHIYALRAKAAPFGNIAPLKVVPDTASELVPSFKFLEWSSLDMSTGDGKSPGANESENKINLDASFDKIQSGSWMLIDSSAVDWVNQPYIELPSGYSGLEVLKADTVKANLTRAAYGIASKSTCIELSGEWFNFKSPTCMSALPADNSFQLIRRTAVYAQSEELELANEPISEPICNGADTWIELDGYYSDLKSGRLVIVSGERADVTAIDLQGNTVKVSGVKSSELVMLSNVIQDVAAPDGTPNDGRSANKALPDERLHTFVKFAKNLEYCYNRDKVTLYGNVVKATHGETRIETLGNGDASKVLQSFTLKQPPLTFVAAPTPVGADSTLKAYVNDIEWHEQDALAWFGDNDHIFATSTDDAGHTTLTFGNGEHGTRLPTGLLNVTAKYRNGIGSVGNVRAEQISLLQSRPLGVKAVINPMRASGGANKESRDLARENAPLSVMPLDRLVSVQDYADFTRRFAGIAKALAQMTTDGRRELVYLTITGVDDAPIDTSSDLYRNLLDALRIYGDHDLPLSVMMRELQMLVLSAKIKILPDFQWEKVVTAVRGELLVAFGFDRRALGQPVRVSEVISCMQNVIGVAYVDVDAFGAVPEQTTDKIKHTRRVTTPADIAKQVSSIVSSTTPILQQDVIAWRGGPDKNAKNVLRPAELAIFTPAVPDTIILNQIS